MTSPRAFVLPVDKPEGPTSHDVVAAARGALGERRIGHTGTLDPFASGLLLLCIGSATRLAEYVSGLDKTYEATARLGTVTDTLDREGEVLVESDAWTALSDADVADALTAFRGDLEQVPPQFSAKKVDGVAMHRRARRGEEVELEPCAVTVQSIEGLEAELPDVRFRVRCSSGTYIRSIARDLGAALGCGAHLTALRRTSVGGFDVERSLPMTELGDAAAVRRVRIDPLAALGHLPAVEIDPEMAARLAHGQKLRLADDAATGLVAVVSDGVLMAIGEVDAGVLRPKKVLVT